MNFINRHVVLFFPLTDSDDIEDVDAEAHPIHFQVNLGVEISSFFNFGIVILPNPEQKTSENVSLTFYIKYIFFN